MILKKLKIENFLTHSNTEIEFPENGIIALLGENGAGKTSIIEAISFALIGKSNKGSNDKLVKWGANYATVELEFQKGKEEFKIERKITLKGNKAITSAVLYKKEKGEYRLFYQKNLNNELPKITGITKKTFDKTVLIKQGDIEGLLTVSSSKRAEIFEELLDLKIYQIIVDKVGELRRFYEKEKQTLILSMTDNYEELKEKLVELEKSYKDLEKDIFKMEEDKNELNENINKLNLDLRIKENEKEKLLEFEKEKSKKIERINYLKEEIKNIDAELLNLETLKEKLKNLEPEIKNLEKLKNLKEKLNKLENLNRELANIEEKIKEINEYKKIIEKYKNIYTEYLKIENEVQSLNSKLLELSKLEGKLNNLKNSKEKILKDLDSYKKEAINIAKSLQKYKPIYKTLELNPTLINEFLKNNEEDINRYEDEIKTIISDKKVLKKEGENLRKQIEKIENLKGSCPTCLRPLEEHTKEEILKELNNEIEEKRKEWKKLNEKEKLLKNKLKEEKEIKKLLEDYKNKYERYLEKEKELKEIEKEIKNIEQKIFNKSELENKIKEYREFLENNKSAYESYKNAEVNLSRYNEKSLNEKFSLLKTEIEKISKDLENIDKETLEREIDRLEKIKEEYIKIKSKISEESKLKDKKINIEKEISLLEEEINKLSKELENKDKIIKEIEDIKANLEKLENKFKNLIEIISNKKIELNNLKNEINNISAKIKEIDEKKKKIENLDIKIKKAEKIESVLGKNGIQRVLRDNLLYELPRLINENFAKFGFPFEQVKFSDNFDIFLLAPTLEKKDRLVDITAISGGQRVALGLALRLALAKFLSSKASFLILDEPTIHLDDQRKSELVNLLIKLKNDSFLKQLIVVSHDTEIEDTADIIYHIEKGKIKQIDPMLD